MTGAAKVRAEPVPAGRESSANQRRVIRSPWIGEIEWDPQCELAFPCGLPGFEQERRMIPVEIPAQRPLVYLQSLEHPDICFVCLPVFVVDPAFSLSLSEEERAVLHMEEGFEPRIGEDVLCLGLLLPFGDSVEVNLSTAIVISLTNSNGVQCVGTPGLAGEIFRLEPDGRWVCQSKVCQSKVCQSKVHPC